MLRAQYVMQSRTMRTDGAIGKIHSFCAWYSFRMSAWIVPDSLSRSRPRFCASATYIASRIHALGLIVSDTEIFVEVDAVEQVLHVGERVDRDALAADLALAHRVVAVVAHQRGHVEVGRQAGLAVARSGT